MNRKQLVLMAALLFAADGAFLVSCGPSATQQAASNPAAAERTEQAPPAAPATQEQVPAVAQNKSTPSVPTPSPTAGREPSRVGDIAGEPVQTRSEGRTSPVTPRSSVPATPPPPIVKTLPAGTSLALVFLDGLSSETNQQGDTFRARVARDVTHDGLVLIPAGSVVVGNVTEAVPLKKIGGTAKLSLAFSAIEMPTGASVEIEATLAEQGKSETKKDAATIGGAAAGGALLGRLVGHDTKGALIGAVVGGAAGTAVAAKTKGEQVEIPVGSERAIELNRPVDISVRH